MAHDVILSTCTEELIQPCCYYVTYTSPWQVETQKKLIHCLTPLNLTELVKLFFLLFISTNVQFHVHNNLPTTFIVKQKDPMHSDSLILSIWNWECRGLKWFISFKQTFFLMYHQFQHATCPTYLKFLQAHIFLNISSIPTCYMPHVPKVPSRRHFS